MDSNDVLGRYLRRNPEADAAYDVSPEYRASMTQARQLLRLADDAMEAEGVPDETRERVLRAVIYGTPNPDECLDVEQRRREQIREAMVATPRLVISEEMLRGARRG